MNNKSLIASGVIIGLVVSKIYNKLTTSIVKKAYDVIKTGRGLVFNSRSDAEEIFNSLNKIIEDYGSVSVADYYDLAEITPNYTDNKIGWTNLDKMKIRKVNMGYTLVMPETITLK